MPTLDVALATRGMLSDADDPLISTAYQHVLSRTLSLVARYSEAADIAELEIGDAARTRLRFVLPHAYVDKAIAQLGLRQFSHAEAALAKADEIASSIGDAHNLVDVETVRCKLALAIGDIQRSLQLTTNSHERMRITAEMRAEFLATRALALACAGEFEEAAATATQAEQLTSSRAAISLTSCARAVIVVKSHLGETDTDAVFGLLHPVFRTATFDPFVIAYRGWPPLLKTAMNSLQMPNEIALVVGQAQDWHLAESVGIHSRRRAFSTPLTPREEEVFDLVALGYTNREIAKALHIAEVTAKVHVRRILHKLGVRSRTEAAVLAFKARELSGPNHTRSGNHA